MESLEEEDVVLEMRTKGQETILFFCCRLGQAQVDQTIPEHQHL